MMMVSVGYHICANCYFQGTIHIIINAKYISRSFELLVTNIMSETKNSSKSFKPFNSLTLLNETGNVEIYRVSEETRKKVEEDTRRINQQNLDLYHKSRKMIKRKEHEKLKVL